MFYLFIVYTLIKIIAGFYKIINFSENYEQYYVKKKRKQNLEKNTKKI
jgi:sortase (surface protein transpeptidase)